jgi:carbamoyltransferase
MLVMGVSGGFGHDASAALMSDGEVVAFVEEERLSRRKYARNEAAVRSVLACARIAGIPLGAIDKLALSWDSGLDPSNDRMRLADEQLLGSPELADLMQRPRFVFDHHSCHAAAARLFADLDQPSVVIVMDGRGELASTSIYVAEGRSLEMVSRSPLEASLGTFYGAATMHCGLGFGGQGKTMALAAYGEPRYEFPELTVDGLAVHSRWDRHGRSEDQDPTARHRRVFREWLALFERKFGPPRRSELQLSKLLTSSYVSEYAAAHADAAASAQAALERLVFELVSEVVQAYPGAHILLAGGVALNCSINGQLRIRLPEVDFNFLPVPHDSGAALGAAALASWQEGNGVEVRLHPYLGAGWEDAELADFLKRCGVAFSEPADLESLVAARLLDGQIIGWFQGRAEAGPRALGHRSMLATPFEAAVVDRLNRHVKARERWRPFAPSVLTADMQELFSVPSAPYMIEAFPMQPSWQLPAVVHVDGSSRPHSADPAVCSPRYLSLLELIKRQTGVGAVLNTSFNVGPEPIVYTPEHAIRTYFASSLDMLVLGPFLLEKAAH